MVQVLLLCVIRPLLGGIPIVLIKALSNIVRSAVEKKTGNLIYS